MTSSGAMLTNSPTKFVGEPNVVFTLYVRAQSKGLSKVSNSAAVFAFEVCGLTLVQC